MKVYENDKEDKFHAQKITVTSRNAKETIVWGLKPDGEPKKKGYKYAMTVSINVLCRRK